MPRARNLKHDFFLDDELADHEPIERLFFAALWCLADYKGDIEWRPKKIKATTLPYDDVDIKSIAINLDKSRFIRFYSDGKKVYLNIRKFSTHQNPHKNEREKGSDIPAYSEKLRKVIDLNTLSINRDLSGLNHDQNETNPADSCNLIPDSCNPIPEKGATPSSVTLKTYLKNCDDLDCDPIPEDSIVFTNAEKLQLPSDYVYIAWTHFKQHWLKNSPRSKKSDWVATFNNCLKSDGYGAYRLGDDGYYLTTKGKATQRLEATE